MFNFAFNSRASWVTVHIDCTQNLGYLFSWCPLEIMERFLHPGNLSLRALEATCGRGWVCPLPFVCCSWRSAAVHPPGWDATRVCSQGRRSGGAQLMPPGINCRRDFCSLSRKWIALPTSVEKKKRKPMPFPGREGNASRFLGEDAWRLAADKLGVCTLHSPRAVVLKVSALPGETADGFPSEACSRRS